MLAYAEDYTMILAAVFTLFYLLSVFGIVDIPVPRVR